MKIGIYGGTFNPPHLGHMVSARYAMEALVIHKIIIGTDNGKLKRRFLQTEKMENADFHMELARMVDDPFILEALEKLEL